MAITAADVPGRYDVVVVTNDGTGYGFMLADEIEPNIPFRSHKALYSISPTFVQRQNISGNYGDNQQDFWLTQSQRDWSLGEQQKFFRSQGGSSQFWQGSGVDVRTPGQVTLRPALKSIALGGTGQGSVAVGNINTTTTIATVGDTNLRTMAVDGTVTDRGAHGLGAAPSRFGIAADGSEDVYFSTTTAGTVGVRKYDGGAATFSTFSATAVDSLAFLNNTLYGVKSTGSAQELGKFDTAGTYTSIFTWKSADGAGNSPYARVGRILPFGGKLLILWIGAQTELWLYDGSGVSLIAQFPPDFFGFDLAVVMGTVFVSGSHGKNITNTTTYATRPAVYFYSNGEVGLLWQADDYITTGISAVDTNQPALAPFNSGLIFNDDYSARLMFYNSATGGVSGIAPYTVAGDHPGLATQTTNFLHTRNGSTAYMFPDFTTVATSGYVISSLIDFDTSLNKALRGVTVQWDAGTGGDGGTVDIAYQLDSLAGAYTTLQTSAVSGTEYMFPASAKGHAVSIKITLNKSTSTTGPTLRRYNVRAAPLLLQFREREFLFHCFGADGSADGVKLRDGTYHPKSGFAMAQDLQTIVQQTIPFTVTDKFGSFTALPNLVADASGNGFEVYEIRSAMDSDPKHPGSFIARFYVREV